MIDILRDCRIIDRLEHKEKIEADKEYMAECPRFWLYTAQITLWPRRFKKLGHHIQMHYDVRTRLSMKTFNYLFSRFA